MACLPDTADCDHISANGCETNLLADSANCGSCGHLCARMPTPGITLSPRVIMAPVESSPVNPLGQHASSRSAARSIS